VEAQQLSADVEVGDFVAKDKQRREKWGSKGVEMKGRRGGREGERCWR